MLCWITGTIYLDMTLKPNILDDIANDYSIAAPPPRERYTSAHTGEDQVMLEDESGRLRLTGPALKEHILVTGVIVSVMGTENKDGEFEVIDLRVAGLAPQPPRYSLEAQPPPPETPPPPTKIALVSGLQLIGETGATLSYDLLLEFLLGESASLSLQTLASQISRLVILGNSLAESNPLGIRDDPFAPPNPSKKSAITAAAKRYGYDASTYNPGPTSHLDTLLSSLLPSLPVTIIPGDSDPANVSIPQQPLHQALFTRSRAYADPPNPNAANAPSGTYQGKKPKLPTPTQYPFHPTTNPAYACIHGHLCLFTAGQPTADIMKYMPIDDEITTLDLMEATLQWRLIAPTAPDTLWCYPYQSRDPFVVGESKCPALYAVGNTEAFGTRIVRGDEGQNVRCVSVPEFRRTGEVVIVDLEDWSVQVVRIGVEGEEMVEDGVESGARGDEEGLET